ncbi:MAG: transporter suffix domain-containing protein [Flavobacteriales bacterium]|nr:transporter suffix domain-containing protein [Flavobacteriales bacterium]
MRKKRSAKFYSKLAIGLLAFSFLPYGMMLFLPYLYLSAGQNAICVTTLVVLAEVFQWLAILIVGKQLILKYKRNLNPMKWLNKNETVYVFKTSITNETDILIVQSQFDTLLKGTKWNFDLEDCDNILRVESRSNITQTVIEILNEHNYECEELK